MKIMHNKDQNLKSVSWMEDIWEFKVARSLWISRLSRIKRSVLLLVLLMMLKSSGDTYDLFW